MKYFAIDVECAATGKAHDARTPIAVSMVDQQLKVIVDEIIQPSVPIVNYLTPLTGISEGHMAVAKCFSDVVQIIREHLPRDSIIVGQGVGRDLAWLGLTQGVDYNSIVDLSDEIKYYNPRYGNYSVFSLKHAVSCVLNQDIQENNHSCQEDAIASMKFFNKWSQLTDNQKTGFKIKMGNTRPAPSFPKLNNYQYQGICLAGFMPKFCICGARNLT